MMRPLLAIVGALVLLLVWLGMLAVQANGDMPTALAQLGEAAQRVRLPGLAAKAYLLASVQEREQLATLDRDSTTGQALVQRIIAHRMAAARTLLRAGYVGAAERIALEGARANYDDLQARALLLEIRLQGADPEAARRELMVMVLQNEHPELLYLLGRAFANSGKPQDAESFYQRALTRDGSHVASLLGMAQIAAARHDAPAVQRWLDKAAQAAEQPAEKRLVARLRPVETDPWQRALGLLTGFVREHGGSLLFAAAYLLFLFIPGLVRLVRGTAGVRPEVQQAATGVV